MDKCTRTAGSYLLPVLDIWSREKEQTVCPISGSCMSPIITEGDSLIIRHGNQDIHRGDVAVYGEPGKLSSSSQFSVLVSVVLVSGSSYGT